jgi:2-haloacid dehalogenase
MQRVIVLDVNETLLDVSALESYFVQVFGDGSIRKEWFGQMLQLAFVSTITNAYRDFGAIGGAALGMVAERHGVELGSQEREVLQEGMQHLPPHPDVRPALERLSRAGYRLATLTNSTAAVGAAQIANAGLTDLFEQMLSADTVKRLKPSPEPYRMAADRLNVTTADLTMIAAHWWDIFGALGAGCDAAFLARPGQVFDRSGTIPEITGGDLDEIVDQILARNAS